MPAMPPKLLCALLSSAVLLAPVSARADGYFTKGEKQLVFKEEGSRTKAQNITLLSLAGATLLSGAVGGYYLLDARDQGNKVSASGMHTLRTWSAELQATHDDALRSNTIGSVAIGISGGLALATIITYIVTQPDMKTGYQDWQAKVPALSPTNGGVVVSRGWSF